MFYLNSVIVDKIDGNNDSFVDLSELKKWIQFTQRRYIDEDVDRQWRQHSKNNEDFVQWEVSTQHVLFQFNPSRPENKTSHISHQSSAALSALAV